jgi:hypothetical protein
MRNSYRRKKIAARSTSGANPPDFGVGLIASDTAAWVAGWRSTAASSRASFHAVPYERPAKQDDCGRYVPSELVLVRELGLLNGHRGQLVIRNKRAHR